MIAHYTISPVISLKTDDGVVGNVTFSINVGLNDDYSITMFDSAPIAATYDGSTPQNSPTGDATPRHVGDSATTRRSGGRHHEGASLADHGRKSHENYKAAKEGAADGSTGSGGPSAAVASAQRLEGAHEVRDNSLIRRYLATGGHGMNPADTSWCAAFVGASLRKAGVKDTGSNMAVSYERWGKHVDPSEGVKRGDVFVEEHGGGKGHVGLLTGRVKNGRVEVISGNYSNSVKTSFEAVGPHHSQIRRATPSEVGPQSSIAKPTHVASDDATNRRSKMLKSDPGNIDT